MAEYEFDHNGVTYPDVPVGDLRVLLEEQAQGIITNPWDELRVRVGKHAVAKVEVRLHGSIMEADKVRSTFLLVRPDTEEVVDEIEFVAPLPTTVRQGRELIERGTS